MTPSFALDLSLDGIRLLYRAEGGWTVVGDVALEDPALAQRLASLRAEAEAMAGEGVATELVIPPSQIRFATIPRPPATVLTAEDLAPAIAGLTPLDLSELAFDWEVEGDEVRIALVDRQTLAEAEQFAAAHGFSPLSFSARPTPAQFPRPPDFGKAQGAPATTPQPTAPVAEAAAAPPPEVKADAVRAEALARSLSAPRPGAPAAPAAARRPRISPAVLGAGGLAAAAALLALWLGMPGDPAASLPETAPDVALSVPALPEPAAAEPPPAALHAAADPAPVAPETAAVVPPEPGAEPAADTQAPTYLAVLSPVVFTPDGPPRPAPPEAGSTDRIYFASIDPVTRASDAIALPAVASFGEPAAPRLAPAESAAAAEAEEVVVTLGPPPVSPPVRTVAAPSAAEAEAPALPEPTELARSLPDRRPLARPEGLAERNERAIFGGRTRAEFAALKPRARPVSAQAAAAAAPAPPTDQAVARSLLPRDRPSDFASRIATAQAIAAALAAPPPPAPTPPQAPQVAAAPPPPAAAPAPAPAATPEEDYDDGETDVASAAPNIPTSASVARQATLANAMSLREINLIGVYGTDRDRRALVRLSNGRFVKVKVGDRLDGGQIAAIGRDELRYVKGGRNITLSVPSG